MWYFSWILGLGVAATFAVLNAMWYELKESDAAGGDATAEAPGDG
ncbi:MAG: cytochrome bd-I oxidase subunit CydX [Pigmentiphaga sp.]|nr:cytochrome bd-I oxidase subunit CydX [Pigmentiphaga sp.]